MKELKFNIIYDNNKEDLFNLLLHSFINYIENNRLTNIE